MKYKFTDKDLEVISTLGMLKDTISNLMGERFNYENLSFKKEDVVVCLGKLQIKSNEYLEKNKK